MPAWGIGHLHMRNQRQVLFHALDHITFRDLAMVKIELHAELFGAHGGDDGRRLIRGVQEKARNIAMIDGFNDGLHAHLGAFFRRIGQVRAINRRECIMRDPFGLEAGHNVQPWAGKDSCVFQGELDAFPKGGLLARDGGHAAFPLAEIPRRRVEQHLLQAIILEPRGNLRRRVFIGE